VSRRGAGCGDWVQAHCGMKNATSGHEEDAATVYSYTTGRRWQRLQRSVMVTNEQT
jgi:hypothetical protein